MISISWINTFKGKFSQGRIWIQILFPAGQIWIRLILNPDQQQQLQIQHFLS